MSAPDDKNPISVDDLEAALARGDDVEIQPDGAVLVRQHAPGESGEIVLTRRAIGLGGHY